MDGSFPVLRMIAVEEGSKSTDSVCNVRASANGNIHEGANQGGIGSVFHPGGKLFS